MTSLRSFALLSLLALPSFAQVKAPRIGFVRCSDHSVRAVYGLPASLVLSRSGWIDSDAAASSAEGLLMSQAGYLRLLKRDGTPVAELRTNESAPVLGLEESLASAIAWLPSQGSIAYWKNTRPLQTAVQGGLGGPVLAIRMAGQAAHLLVSESGGAVSEATVDLDHGNLQSSNLLPRVQAPATWVGDSLVYARDGELVVEKGDGTQTELPFPDAHRGTTLTPMEKDWVHVASAGGKRNWALHLSENGPTLTEMPTLRAAAGTANTGGSR